MHRPTLLIGLGLIVLMCLVPPFHTGAVDNVTDALGGEEVTQVEYHPIWARPDGGDAVLSALQSWEIAGGRLLLQIVGVVLVTGGVAYKLES